MTTFYTYAYLKRQPAITTWLLIGIAIALIIAATISIALFMRHRDDGKYRDLSIILITALILAGCIQYSSWTQKSSQVQSSTQVSTFLKNVSQAKDIPVDKITCNSTTLNNGMLLRIKKNVYQVEFNSDNSSYQLHKAELTNPEIKIQN